PGGAGVENLVFANQAHGESVHQRIARVARFKLRFASKVGNAKAVAVRSHTAHDSFEDGVVSADLDCSHTAIDRPEAQRIHHCHRPRTHGENIAQDSTDACGCA